LIAKEKMMIKMINNTPVTNDAIKMDAIKFNDEMPVRKT